MKNKHHCKKFGLMLMVLAMSSSIQAKSLLDVFIDKAVDKVSETVQKNKPIETRALEKQKLAPCEYVDKLDNTRIVFECEGQYINGGNEIFIKTDKPIMLSPAFDKTPYQSFKAKQNNTGIGDWQISVLTETGYEARLSFLYVTGGGAGAPGELTFNNGADSYLTINLINPNGD